MNLQSDFRCAIHTELRERGFPGCTVFDCQGAGQRVSQVIFRGADWRSDAALASQMFEVFARVRELHMLLWHLDAALQLPTVRSMHATLRREFIQISNLSSGSPEALLALDVGARTRSTRDLLRRISALARANVPRPHKDYTNADLIGARLRRADLRGASLRGAQLIAADLRGADLRVADLTVADMRNTDLRGADLSEALFVRQSQLDSARGDEDTRLPPRLRRPSHWYPRTLGG